MARKNIENSWMSKSPSFIFLITDVWRIKILFLVYCHFSFHALQFYFWKYIWMRLEGKNAYILNCYIYASKRLKGEHSTHVIYHRFIQVSGARSWSCRNWRSAPVGISYLEVLNSEFQVQVSCIHYRTKQQLWVLARHWNMFFRCICVCIYI